MTVTVFRQSYMTQRPSLFTLISYCGIVFSFALLFANGWFTACDGFYSACTWLSHRVNGVSIYMCSAVEVAWLAQNSSTSV